MAGRLGVARKIHVYKKLLLYGHIEDTRLYDGVDFESDTDS